MRYFHKLSEVDLQLFAEGAGGAGDGAGAEGASGVSAADAGQQNTGAQGAASAELAVAADAGQQTDPDADFEALIKDRYKDQFHSRVEKIVQARLKASTQALQRYEAAQPIFEILAQNYGIDATDLEAIAKAVQEDASFYQEEAIAKGLDVSDLMRYKQLERDNASMRRTLDQQREQQERQRIQQQARQQHDRWIQEAQALKQSFPAFDLNTELKNEAFGRMLSSGVPMKAAYTALHADEIMRGAMQFAAQRAAQQVTDTVIAGAARPAENGTGSQGAVAPKVDPGKLSDKEIMEYRERARRGEKVTFT